jgi:flagellar hook-length control protein FliK
MAAGPVAAALAASLSGKPGVAAPPVSGVESDVASAVSAAASAAPAVIPAMSADPQDKPAHGGTGNGNSPADGGVAAAQSAVNSTTTGAALPPSLQKLDAPVGSAEFSQGLAERVSYLVNNNLGSATLQVSPPQLGPIDIRIAIQGGHAQVWMSATSAVTRDALSSSSTQLREMLGNQGFGQVSVDISQRSFQERTSYAQNYDWQPSADPGSTTAAAAATPRAAQGALDAYA